MKLNSVLKTALIALFAMTLGSFAHAQEELGSPGYVDYQGYISKSDKSPYGSKPEGSGHVPDPEHLVMQFKIYDAQTGGKLVWAEHQTVTVDMGRFSVRLGAGVNIDDMPVGTLTGGDIIKSFNGSERYLGVTVIVDGQGGEIVPRLAFQSSPFSFVSMRAVEAEKAKFADVAAKVTDTNVALLDRPNQNFTGPLGVGTTPASGVTLHVQNPGANTAELQIGARTGSSADTKRITFGDPEYVYIGEMTTDDHMELRASQFYFKDGNVGIGTTTADEKLVVLGNIKHGDNAEYLAPAVEERTRILHGTVYNDTDYSGTGWTSTRTSAGVIRIDFITPFSEVPTVTFGSSASKGDDNNYVLSYDFKTTSSVTIYARQSDTNLLWNQPFDFIIMGSY
jgi:hypothetical protein